MKEYPILFSTPMAQALLNTKPGVWPAEPIDPAKFWKWQTRRIVKPRPAREITLEEFKDFYKVSLTCKYQLYKPYQVGDRLWARETWAEGNGKDLPLDFYYKASVRDPTVVSRWKPSIFMPRAAARILLEVKAVRIEELQNISELDAKAEGVGRRRPTSIGFYYTPGYKELWDTLNAKQGYSWDSNPFVWVYEFMRVS